MFSIKCHVIPSCAHPYCVSSFECDCCACGGDFPSLRYLNGDVQQEKAAQLEQTRKVINNFCRNSFVEVENTCTILDPAKMQSTACHPLYSLPQLLLSFFRRILETVGTLFLVLEEMEMIHPK